MHFDRRQLILIGFVALIIVGAVITYLFGRKDPMNQPRGEETSIVMWGVYDPISFYDAAAANYYAQKNADAKIIYYQMDPETYEEDLLNALAAGEGPDIFMIHNTWIPKHFNKIWYANESMVTAATAEPLFPEVVMGDFAPQGSVYALPLSIDTLALYYNKDLFDQAGIALPPKTWSEFEAAADKLKKIDRVTGKVIRAGAALGGSAKSISRAADIVSLLMLQRRAQMVSDGFDRATFGAETGDLFSGSNPGLEALEFYTKFANPYALQFTWSDDFSTAIDAFSEGSAAMMLGYLSEQPNIREKNPFLNFGIAPMLQQNPDAPVNYASYWGYTVRANSENYHAAWDFILFLTTQEDQARVYMDASGKPPALRALIGEKINDSRLGAFARQSLTARSWLQPDSRAVDAIFSDMIQSVITGRFGLDEALSNAEREVTALIERSRFMK
ncbi:MAG: hypothetical protein A2939_03685 [Parcubacteria group bacterium RIFCSPLOWO2_01_FULL_48_18]|nr:MAG: hypothetical protein A3J67_02625 [Parcubacteria group bacterium RIFCSPHIGHO2_02_FULL_48_10b]OHB22379.1 MAG: hypothetical protein A2939_03685 [Parcubacteria group bacterium RIFCSPLOWO2_01_FULL_48_18]